MKKIVAIIVTVALCAMCCVVFAACDYDVNVEKLYQKCNVHEEYSCGGIISVDAGVCSVYFRNNLESNDKIFVDYVKNDAFTVSCDNADPTHAGTLKVECKWENNKVSVYNNFIIISVPQSSIGYFIEVEGNVGSVRLKDVPFLRVSVALTTGSFYMENCNVAGSLLLDATDNTQEAPSTYDVVARSLSVALTTGSIHVENCDISGNMILSTTTGSIHADDVSAYGAYVSSQTGSVALNGDFTDDVEVETTTGSIDADVDAKRVTLKATTGSIHFDSDAEIINITTSTGSVRGEVQGAKAAYSINVTTTTGSSNLTNQTVEGDKRLQIQTSTGSVKVSFEN